MVFCNDHPRALEALAEVSKVCSTKSIDLKRVDITGGKKLLSDAAVIAAVATGSDVCCFQVKARRLQLLRGMGVRELLPKAAILALKEDHCLKPLTEGKANEGHGNLLVKMKETDLITLQELDGEVRVGLTDRGQACRD